MSGSKIRALALRLRARHAATVREDGFTLIELIIISVVLPLVIGAVTVVMITTLKATDSHDKNGITARLAESHDAQVTSADFARDVQSSTLIQTNNPSSGSTTPICGTGKQLLGLEWNINQTNVGVTKVSYVWATVGGKDAVVRNYCSSSSPSVAPTLKTQSTVSHNTAPPISTPTLTCVTSLQSISGCTSGSTAQGPLASQYVALVEVDIPETSGFIFQLMASPRQLATTLSCLSGSCMPPPPPLLLLGTGGANCASGNPSITVNGAAAVNSSSSGSLQFHNGQLTATQVYSQNTNTTYPGTSSTATVSPPSDYNYTGPPPASSNAYTPGQPLVDAYSSLPVPNPSAPNTYTYTTPLTTGNDGAGNLKSGVYILQNGITLNGNSSLASEAGGVFFYVTGGSVTIGGSATITFNPMTSGPYAGILLYQIPSDSQTMTLDGSGAATSLNGAIAAPSAPVTLKGGGSGSGLTVLGLEASSVSCNGNGSAVLGPPLTAKTTVTSSENPAPNLQTVTFTATVSTTTSGYPAPTAGTVSFTETPSGGLATPMAGCSNLSLSSSSTATCSTSTLSTAGSPYTITATYSGSAGYNAGSPGTLTETIVVAGFTLASSANPSLSGQSVTFTGTVSGVTPTGTETFTIKDKNNGTAYTCNGGSNTVTMSGGSATCVIAAGKLLSTLSPFSVSAAYSGDTNNAPSNASLTQTVNTGKLHVSAITGSSSVNGSHWHATVVVTVVDSFGNTVSGVSVTGSFSPSGPTPTGGTTNSSGICSFTTGNINTTVPSETWTVSGLALAGYTYDSSSNVVNSVTVTH